jgi:hypothetical protein
MEGNASPGAARWILRVGSAFDEIDLFSDRGGVDTRNKEEREERQKDCHPNGEHRGFEFMVFEGAECKTLI